jgi:hypothetical protein
MAFKISALTFSGGKLSEFGGAKAVKEYRVWVHPKPSGDDYYYVFKDFLQAKEFSDNERKKVGNKYNKVEMPLAVVWDKKYRRYREIVI